MPARSHYTLRSKKDVENARDEEDAAAKLRAELVDHYAETFTIALQRRNPSSLKWEDVQVLDLVHEDTSQLTPEAREIAKQEQPTRIEELAEDLIAMAETEASVEGGARFRAIGRAERAGPNKTPLFEVPWIAGGPLLESERKLQAEDAKASALTSTTRALETAHRLLERTWRSNTTMAESATKYHTAMVGNVTTVLETQAKIEAPSIASLESKAQREKAKMEHDERMQEDRDSHELLLEALAVFGKALDADRRDRKEDARRKRGEVIDVEPKGEPKNGAPKNGSNGASAPDMHRPEVPRCAEARELAEMLDDLDEQQAVRLRDLLTAHEIEAIFRCADSATRDEFDRNFRDVDAEWQKRGQAGTSALQSQLATILGLKAFAFKNLVVKWEKRTHGSPPQ